MVEHIHYKYTKKTKRTWAGPHTAHNGLTTHPMPSCTYTIITPGSRLDIDPRYAICGAIFSWSKRPISSSFLAVLTFLLFFCSRGLFALGGVTLSWRLVESASGTTGGETDMRAGDSMKMPPAFLAIALGVSMKGRRPP